MGNTFSMTHPRLTSFKHKSAPLKSKNVVLLKPEIFSPKMKTPLRAGLCVEFERKNNDLNDINEIKEIKEIKESLLNILKIFHLFNLFRLFPYGLCRRDCKSSLSQREDLGGNVSMGVVSHLFLLPYGLCRRNCKSSLLQREDLGGNVSMSVESHLFFVPIGIQKKV